VSTLNRAARDLLEAGFASVWVEGELSNVARPRSGHVYFSLKDANAQVRCAMWRSYASRMAVAPEEGLAVLCRARVSLYEARGDFQLIVEYLEPAGEGRLRQQFEELKARLDREGLFAAEAKRPLPALPRRIGVVTSPTGAALRDVLHVLARRFPAAGVVVYPTRVQGDDAAAEIAAALASASRRGECDVLILARGGGSLEDLWPFNEEAVARAIRASQIPVIAGIGHETDVTIADLAADLRAPTPSGAAEVAVPEAETLAANLARLDRRLAGASRRCLARASERLRFLERRLASAHPGARLRQQAQRVDELELRCAAAIRAGLVDRHNRLLRLRRRLDARSPEPRLQAAADRTRVAALRLGHALATVLGKRRGQLAGAARALQAVSPLATLERGYAIAYGPDGRILRDPRGLSAGDGLRITLARGGVDAEVRRVLPAGDEDARSDPPSEPGAER
jgi:exodeoxyribonuclease VII large subunit